ncbi:MAG TPA: guanylate kinase [Terriglobales bacterium]|nr:guanylate kinase [Terriglobales bacterium]
MSGLLFIISAPSGSGKSTLVNELRSLVDNLDFSISYTTRPPRGSEQNGREYYFVTRPEFEAMIAADQFLEHAEVFGNYYGTACRFFDEAKRERRDLLLDIDVQGAEQVRKKVPDAVSIFVMPPNREILERRLRSRNQADKVKPEVIERRLENAQKEIVNYEKYRYILVNAILEHAVEELKAIVLSERIRRSGKTLTGEEQKLTRIADQCLLANSHQRVQPVLASFKIDGYQNHPPR